MSKRKTRAPSERNKRDRRRRRRGELPPWLAGSVVAQEKRHGPGRRSRD